MTFAFEPPRSLLYFVIVIVAANLAVLVLSRRHPARKVLGLIVGAVLMTMLLIRFHRIGASSVTIDDAGIVAVGDGVPRIPWSDVQSAVYVPDLWASPFRPREPDDLLGTFGDVNARYGWYRLANGGRALAAVEHSHGAAVVITTADATYLVGPHDVPGFAQAIAGHVPLTDWGTTR